METDTHDTTVVSSPILIARIDNPYQARYSEEHLDDCREQYSEVFTEQPPPLYLNLLDSVEDLKTSTYQTNHIHKEKNRAPALQDEECCSSFGLFLDWLFCCTPTDIHTPIRRF